MNTKQKGMNMLKRLILTLGGILIMTTATESNADTPDPENTLYMRLSTGGTVTIEMKPDLAPKHVERIKELTREGRINRPAKHSTRTCGG